MGADGSHRVSVAITINVAVILVQLQLLVLRVSLTIADLVLVSYLQLFLSSVAVGFPNTIPIDDDDLHAYFQLHTVTIALFGSDVPDLRRDVTRASYTCAFANVHTVTYNKFFYHYRWNIPYANHHFAIAINSGCFAKHKFWGYCEPVSSLGFRNAHRDSVPLTSSDRLPPMGVNYANCLIHLLVFILAAASTTIADAVGVRTRGFVVPVWQFPVTVTNCNSNSNLLMALPLSIVWP